MSTQDETAQTLDELELAYITHVVTRELGFKDVEEAKRAVALLRLADHRETAQETQELAARALNFPSLMDARIAHRLLTEFQALRLEIARWSD